MTLSEALHASRHHAKDGSIMRAWYPKADIIVYFHRWIDTRENGSWTVSAPDDVYNTTICAHLTEVKLVLLSEKMIPDNSGWWPVRNFIGDWRERTTSLMTL